MRSIILRLEHEGPLPQHVKEDLLTVQFRDFRYIDYNTVCAQLCTRNQPCPNAPVFYRKKHEREVLTQCLRQFCDSVDTSLPSIGLPTEPVVVLLSNFSAWDEYSGTVTLKRFAEKQSEQIAWSQSVHIIAYYAEDNESAEQSARGKKAPAVETVQYMINDVRQTAPVQLAIIQQIAADFVLRQLYITTLTASGIVNISGRSLELQVYPRIFTTPGDARLSQLYDVAAIGSELVRSYNHIITKCIADQHQIPVIIGCMIDAVIIIGLKKVATENELDHQILRSEEDLMFNELTQCDHAAPQPVDHPIHSINLLDSFSEMIAGYKTGIGRHYFMRCADAVVKASINKFYDDQSPKTVMAHKASFSELVRMFMNELPGENNLVDVESIIRKTLIFHLRRLDSAHNELGIINAIDPDEMRQVNFDEYQIVKLGSFEQQKHNYLSVISQVDVSHDVPLMQTVAYDELTNLIAVNQEVQKDRDGVITDNAPSKEQLMQCTEAELKRLCRLAQVDVPQDVFTTSAPSYAEFRQSLAESTRIVRSQQDGQDTSKPSGKTAKGQSGDAPQLELNFENSFNRDEIAQLFDQVQSQPKQKSKEQAPAQTILNPFLMKSLSNLDKLIGYVVHLRYKSICTGGTCVPSKNEGTAKGSDHSGLEQDATVRGTLYPSLDEVLGDANSKCSLRSVLGIISVINRGIPTPSEQPQLNEAHQTPKQPQKGKQANSTSQSLITPQNLLHVDRHLAVLCYLVQNFGDEKHIYLFNELIKLVKHVGSIDLNSKSPHKIFFLGSERYRGNNITYNDSVFDEAISQLFARLAEREQLIRQIPGYQGQYQFSHAECETFSGDYQIASCVRSYQPFYTLVADRAIIQSEPLRNRIKVTRYFCGVRSNSRYFNPSVTFSDYMFLSGYNTRTTATISTRPPSASAQKGKKLATQDTKEYVIPSEYQGLQLMRQRVVGPSEQSIQFYTEAQFSAQFQDMVSCTARGECIKIFTQQVAVEVDIGSGQMLVTGQGVKIHIIRNTANVLLAGRSFEVEPCSFTGDPQDVEIPNHYNNVQTLVSNRVLNFVNFDGDETLKIQYVRRLDKRFYVISVNTIVSALDDELQPYSIVDVEDLGVTVLFGANKALVIHEQGNVVRFDTDKRLAQLIKQDGAILQFFNVESKGSAYYEHEAEAFRQHEGHQHQRTQPQPKKAKEEPVQPQAPERKIFSAPLLLYAGPGFAFWNSVLYKRARYNCHSNINSRINFDLQRKLNPTICNPERSVKFEIRDVFATMTAMHAECASGYEQLPPFSNSLSARNQEHQNLARLHHELFLPASSTQVSTLQGVYRFLLGAGNDPESPLYPSVSVYDWAGNTTHVRLGSSSQNTVLADVPQDQPQEAANKGKQQEPVMVRRTLFANDNAAPQLPPTDNDAVQTDMIAQVDNLITERQCSIKRYIEEIQRLKEDEQRAEKEAARSPSKGKGKQTKGAQNAIPEACKREAVMEPIEKRPIEQILSELKQVEMKSPVVSLLAGLMDGDGSTAARRRGSPVHDDTEMEAFIRENINQQMPCPANRIVQKRFIMIPIAPECRQHVQSYRSLVENDVPWIILNRRDVLPITYAMQIHDFSGTPSLSINLTPETFSVRFLHPISYYLSAAPPAFLTDLQNTLERIASKFSEATNGMGTVLRSVLPILKVQQDEYAFQHSECIANQYITIYNYETDGLVDFWQKFERSKELYRQIVQNRRNVGDQNGMELSSVLELGKDDLLAEVKDIVAAEKKDQLWELERQRQRQKELELETELQKQKALQQEKLKQQQQNQLDDFYVIDKPLGKKVPVSRLNNPNMIKNVAQKPKQISQSLSDEDDSDDDYLDIAQIKSQTHQKKFPVLKGIEKASIPTVLPMIKHQMKGQVWGQFLRAIPDKLNSRQEKNAVIIKSLVNSHQDVEILYDKSLVTLNKVKFAMKPYESVNIIIQHIKFGDSELILKSTSDNAEDEISVRIIW